MNAITIASPLSRKAVLCAVNISQWTARKLDRKITDKVNREHHAKADAGRYNKLLIQASHLKQLNETVSAARELHYKMTKPWGDDGARILPNVLYVEFTNKFRALRQQFDDAVEAFCRDYPRYVEERRKELNGMFNQADYPSANEIRSKFNMELRFSNLPEAQDFRSDVLDADTVADIKSEIERTAKTAESAAMTDTYQQLADVVGHMVKKLGDYKVGEGGKRSFFMDSLVDNVRDLVKLLPAFNLAGDERLDKLAARIERELCVEDAKTLRDNDEARATVQKSAEQILADVEKYMA